MSPEAVAGARDDDSRWMGAAVDAAATVRCFTSPNPWVGAVVVDRNGVAFVGATQPPGGAHAEVVALGKAGTRAQGATLYVTLEPCSHHGRTPPCTDAIIASGVARVVVAVDDPDRQVSGTGLAKLRAAGIEVSTGVLQEAVTAQLAPYLKHRRTGRPWVVLKAAATLDGRTAAPDGSSQWITGAEARADAHRLRAESDAIAAGAGTVRRDDPALTVRLPAEPTPPAATVAGVLARPRPWRQPRRVVIGSAPGDAAVHPCLEWTRADGSLVDLLVRLGSEGVVQLLVEGGATVAGEFHRQGLVDRYVFYLAPALAGGDDAHPLFSGPGASTMADLTRGKVARLERLGDDIRLDLVVERLTALRS